ncbi:hypothetical protein D3C84_840760 [compost metagenome]
MSRRPPGEPFTLGSRLYSVSLYLWCRAFCSARLPRKNSLLGHIRAVLVTSSMRWRRRSGPAMVRLSMRLVMIVRSARACSAHSSTERTLWPTSRPISQSRVRKRSIESRNTSWSALSSRISRSMSE